CILRCPQGFYSAGRLCKRGTYCILGLRWKECVGVTEIVLCFSVSAQEIWTLEKCIRHARENSLNIKQGNIAVQNAEINLKDSKANRLPSVDGSVSVGLNFGRRIDPTTNGFVDTRITSNSYNLSSGMTLWNGGRIKKGIEQSEVNLEAAQMDVDQTRNDVALNVANAYLNVLFAQENLANSKKQLEIIQEQLKQVDQLIEAGTRPRNERLDLLARIAGIEQTIITNENNIEINLLQLKQLLLLEPEENMRIEVPNIDDIIATDPEQISFGETYAYAVENQPRFKSRKLRKEAAEIGVDIAKTGNMPSLTVGVGIGTQASSANNVKVDRFQDVVLNQDVFIDGAPAVLGVPSELPITSTKTYFNQLDENLGYGGSLSLNIPIFDRGFTKNNVERAKLNILSNDVTEEQEKQALKTDIQNAVTTARANKKQMEAAEKTVESLQLAFENAKKRFELGAINTFDYITAQNNLETEQINLLIAKYQYVFSMKVIDFYLGKEILLN
ncbi:MAG: TolC family protein, partial [Bacteroidota bacterium]